MRAEDCRAGDGPLAVTAATLGFAEILAARERLAGVALRTPLIENAQLNRRAGGRVLLKAENLQRTGSFKIRGAYNLMSQLAPEQRAAGVVAWSSGNHAQGAALAGKLLGIPIRVLMPADAPAAKRDATRRLGGEILLYDRYREDREAIARDLAAASAAAIVPSYDHPEIIAGQGTVGLEIAEQMAEIGTALDRALICCGGGGLTAGSALALRRRFPEVRVHTVEPEGYDDTARSLTSARRERADVTQASICDALMSPMPGELTWPILMSEVESGLVVSEAEVRDAMRFAFRELKMVLEPGGAVALAAVLAGQLDTADAVTAVVLSGGNVDPALFAAIQADSD